MGAEGSTLARVAPARRGERIIEVLRLAGPRRRAGDRESQRSPPTLRQTGPKHELRRLFADPQPHFHPVEGLLAALEAALSKEEIRRVLAGNLLALDEMGRQRLIEWLGPETGTTLQEVLGACDRRVPSPPAGGKAKVREAWDQLWHE